MATTNGPPQMESPASAATDRRAQTATHTPNTITPSIDTVIARLDRVRRCGRGFIARCPAHEDKSASLSLAEGGDGRILLHCFAGCESADVVAALGFEWRDLFPRRIDSTLSPAERSQIREAAKQAQWAAALSVLGREATVVLIAAREVRAGPLSADDEARVVEAAQRIESARMVLCSGR